MAVKAGHVGLATVRRRVEDVGGPLEIATRPDGGTHVRVVLPAWLGCLDGQPGSGNANGPG